MAAVLERKSSSSLFSETAAQRFRRESQEVWEEINKKEENEEVEVKIKKLSLTERLSQSGTKPVVTTPSRSRDPVKLITTARQPANKESELFPKKVKSKFIKTRPASWEKDFEKEEKEAEPPKPKAEKPTIRRLSERTKLAQARKI